MPQKLFADRVEAGQILARRVVRYLADNPAPGQPLVLALPRGGVPVAVEVARAINAELGIVVARELDAPRYPQFGVGGLAEDGPPVFDHDALRYLGRAEADLTPTVDQERAEIQRRIRRYRGDRPIPWITGRVVILVDDGLSTGAAARAAVYWLRVHRPRRVVLAVPVCAPQARDALASGVDAIICTDTNEHFQDVGEWYTDFTPLTDEDVQRLLAAYPSPSSAVTPHGTPGGHPVR